MNAASAQRAAEPAQKVATVVYTGGCQTHPLILSTTSPAVPFSGALSGALPVTLSVTHSGAHSGALSATLSVAVSGALSGAVSGALLGAVSGAVSGASGRKPAGVGDRLPQNRATSPRLFVTF